MRIPTQVRPSIAVVSAILVLHFLSGLGLSLVMYFTGPFSFWPDSSGTLTFRMMGSFFLVRFGSFLFSVYIATLLIYLGRFSRPYTAVMTTIGGFHLLRFVLRWRFDPPTWSTPAQFDAALFFECLSIVLLVGFGALMLRIIFWLDERRGNKRKTATMAVQSTPIRADGADGRD